MLVERCRSAVADWWISHDASDVSDVVTISAGLSASVSSDSPALSSIFDAVDKMLCQAKQKGRILIEYAWPGKACENVLNG